VTTRALTWNSGSAANATLSWSISELAASIQALATSMAWVCAASFGAPVVPPVWNSAARSADRGGSPTKAAVSWPAASSGR